MPIVPFSEKPNLKPFRNNGGRQIINGLYAHISGSVNKGTVVSVLTSPGHGNPFAYGSGTGTPVQVPSDLPGTPSYAYAPMWTTPAKVTNATTGQPVLGILLNDVRPYDYSNPYSYQDFRANQIIPSGKSVSIATEGEFTTNNWTGATPAPGLGAYASGGTLVITSYTGAKAEASFAGQCLSEPDADGYFLFKLETL